MTVDVFEAEKLIVACRHQFDDTLWCMGRNTRLLVEAFPTTEIGFDVVRDAAHEGFRTDGPDIAHHVVDTDEGHIGQIGRVRIVNDLSHVLSLRNFSLDGRRHGDRRGCQ